MRSESGASLGLKPGAGQPGRRLGGCSILVSPPLCPPSRTLVPPPAPPPPPPLPPRPPLFPEPPEAGTAESKRWGEGGRWLGLLLAPGIRPHAASTHTPRELRLLWDSSSLQQPHPVPLAASFTTSVPPSHALPPPNCVPGLVSRAAPPPWPHPSATLPSPPAIAPSTASHQSTGSKWGLGRCSMRWGLGRYNPDRATREQHRTEAACGCMGLYAGS